MVDKSGSMMGEKINLLKDTLHQILEVLNENDRLCIVEFESTAKGVVPLKRVTQNNLDTFKKGINSINAGGGTSIESGMRIACQVLNQRKFKNQVASIFLLTDGLDNSAYQAVPFTIIG